MTRLFTFITTVAMACCALSATTYAQTLQQLTTAVRSDPKIGPLMACYNDGMESGLHEMAVAAKTEAQFKIVLLVNGGLPALGTYVKKACDEAFRKLPPTAGRDETIEGIQPLFLEFLRSENRAFMKACASATGSDSEKAALAKLCTKAASIEEKVNARK